MENLTGIALVVDDIHKGCNLAFRYPVSFEHLYEKGISETEFCNKRKSGISAFHSLSASLFAKLFRPKNNLCGQCFELTIDNVRFISYPVQVIKHIESHGSSECEESHFQHSFGPSSGDRGSSPTSKCLSNKIGGCLNALSIDDVGLTSKVFENNKSETRMFNLVFAMEENTSKKMTINDCDSCAIAQLQSTVQQITKALLHEEVRTSFVSHQVRTLLMLRDDLIQQRRLKSNINTGPVNNLSTTSHRVYQGDSAVSADVFDLQTFVDLSLCKSTLANDLKRVYHELKELGFCHLRVNDWVNVSVTLSSVGKLDMTRFRPYHTLLLLRERNDVLDSLPVDATQQIRTLVEAANPLKNFRELSIETSLTQSQLYRLSAHLVHWNHAKIVDTITLHNVYKVRSDDGLLSSRTLGLQFRKRFSRQNFYAVLASFTGCRRLGESMKNLSPAQKSEHVLMLVNSIPSMVILSLD